MRQIAIDGPAGAGKSTIAKALSAKLNFMYVDTGAMYRTIALYCLRNNADIDKEDQIAQLSAEAPIRIRYEDGKQLMFLDEEDVTAAIRQEEVGNTASAISKYAAVRKRLVAMQQQLGREYDVVMDGRDIGTQVLPEAGLKIYLTASVEVRAERRYRELIEKGQECNFEDIKKDIEQRDYNDMHREISPLCKAEDAVELDTSDLNIEEVVTAATALYEKAYA